MPIVGKREIIKSLRTEVRSDLPDFCGERLAHFPGLSLEGDGALEAERWMPPDGVMEPVDVSGDGVFGLLAGLPVDCH
jgi:hypothetical protein